MTNDEKQPAGREPVAREALQLKALLESAASGILSIDRRGIVRTANPAACHMFGYAPEEIVGRNVSVLMGGHDRASHDTYMHRYITTGVSGIMGKGREVSGQRKDGTTFPLHLSIGEFEADGERYFTGVLIDLTKQKAAEESAERRKALFRAIFDCLPDPVVVIGRDGVVRNVNPSFTRVFGVAAGDIVGHTTRRLHLHEEDWQRIAGSGADPCPELDNTHNVPPRIVDFVRADGETFPGTLVRTSIDTPAAGCMGYLELIRDISTERRRAAQLMQAQRMEAIGQLTGGIAHDFNNILTVVLGNVELLEMRHEPSDRAAPLLREAREAAEIGARLTDRLLTFGRRQMLETRKINLNEFVLGMTELIRRTIGEDIDLSTALDADLALTHADPGQVENALLNLAINARDAMPKGGLILIETRNVVLDEASNAATPELAPGSYVALSVSDTGVGMSSEVKARAFEPFFTTKAGGTGRGTGLGLATIYGFAKQSGGHATISSESGHGTTVELYLPAAVEVARAAEVVEKSVALPTGNGRRVLVVEDNDSVRRLARRQIEALGYTVEDVANGIEALERLAVSADFDVVFSDVVMPGGLSGTDLAREVERHFPGIAVVLTTGYAEEMIAGTGSGAARHNLIRKPYSQTALAG
ncbi:MAG: PAS domain S-box protein, partial [Hyphomicrobiaceae bacterium]